MKAIRFLTPEQIISLQREVEQEQNAFLNENSLYACCAKFMQGYYDELSVFDLAVMYFEDIVQKHIFANGNKRTAILSAVVFLEMNGYRVSCDSDRLYQIIMNYFETKNAERLLSYFKEHSAKRDVVPPYTQEYAYHSKRVIHDFQDLISELAKT